MKKIFVLIITTLVLSGFHPKSKWTVLFNGKNLKGWDTYLGPRFNVEKENFDGEPMGLSNDPDKVFSVVNMDGEGVLRVSGEHFGGISTQQEFENYHLQLQFKWGEKKWLPRKEAPRDSGLLYHAVGPHAQGWFFWMRSEELQIQEGDCGDFWGIAGAGMSTTAIKISDEQYRYDPMGEQSTFGGLPAKLNDRLIKQGDGENPYGQWNTIDLYCYGDTSVHVVNDKVVMVLYKLRQADGKDEKPLTRGKIQLQTEGAEIFYKNIQIQSIDGIPDKLIK